MPNSTLQDVRAILSESDNNDSLWRAISLLLDVVQEQGIEIDNLKKQMKSADRAIAEAHPDFKGW